MSDEQIQSLREDVHALRGMVQDLQQELREEKRKRQQLAESVETVLDVAGMLESVQQNGGSDWDTYAAAILRSLAGDAHRSGDDRATMTARECHNTLQRQPHRTSCLDILRHTADLVDTPAVVMIEEDRASSNDSRLVVDLSAGDLPEQVNGTTINPEVSA